jgi:hypothetical protein
LVVRRRRTPLDLRVIPTYQSLPLMIDEAIESDRLPHFSLGSAAVGGETTLAALAGAEVIYYLVNRLAFTRRVPLITLSDPITLLLASDTLRRAYLSRDNLSAYRFSAVAWFPQLPQGKNSLAFAAGAALLAQNEGITQHILLGNFGLELGYLLEAQQRRDQSVLAQSISLEGQAIAMTASDTPLIGEELFVGGAYLDRKDTLRMGSLVAQDMLRWIIIFSILVAVLYYAVD